MPFDIQGNSAMRATCELLYAELGGARLQTCITQAPRVPALAAEIILGDDLPQRLKPNAKGPLTCTPEGVLHPGRFQFTIRSNSFPRMQLPLVILTMLLTISVVAQTTTPLTLPQAVAMAPAKVPTGTVATTASVAASMI